MGIAPPCWELAATPEQYQLLADHFRQRDDLLNFAIGCLQCQQKFGAGGVEKK
jgi:hypothetical protein